MVLVPERGRARAMVEEQELVRAQDWELARVVAEEQELVLAQVSEQVPEMALVRALHNQEE